jgi:hypothetical protein
MTAVVPKGMFLPPFYFYLASETANAARPLVSRLQYHLFNGLNNILGFLASQVPNRNSDGNIYNPPSATRLHTRVHARL